MASIRLLVPVLTVLLFSVSAVAQDAPVQAEAAQQPAPEGFAPVAAPPPPPQYPAPAPVMEAPPPSDELAPNSVFAEGLGAGLFYSINYERLVIPQLGVRVGFSYMSFSASAGTASSSATYLTFPITASYLGIRSGSHVLELGGGATLAYASGSSSGGGLSASGAGIGGLGTLMVGYRIHPLSGGGFQFRIGAMLLIGPGLGFSATDPSALGVLPWGYISFGGSF